MKFINLETSDAQKSILQGLWEQFEEGINCDCRLVAEGSVVDVNSAILSAASPYFKTALSYARDNKRDKIMIFETLSYYNLKQMIRYLYKGELTIEECHLPSFLQTLKNFKIAEPAKVPTVPALRIESNEHIPISRTQEIDEDDIQNDNLLTVKEESEEIAKIVGIDETKAGTEIESDSEEEKEFKPKKRQRRDTNFAIASNEASKVTENLKKTTKGGNFRRKSIPVMKFRGKSNRFIKTSSDNCFKYKCKFCPSITKTAGTLSRHQRFCKLNPSREIVICSNCGVKYSRSDNLRIHMLKCSQKMEDV